jgi:hypothetical protein
MKGCPDRSIILTFLLFTVFLPLDAQFNRIGGGLAFNSPISSPDLHIGNPGFHFRGVYEINRKFFVIPSLTVQIPKKKIYSDGTEKLTYLGSLDANVTYSLAIEKQLLFYALIAPNFTNIYTSWEPENPDHENKYEFCPGIGIGTGIEMIVEGNFNAFAQIKYIIGKYQQLVIDIGVYYYFEGRIRRIW